jgi:hypothetical protein
MAGAERDGALRFGEVDDVDPRASDLRIVIHPSDGVR